MEEKEEGGGRVGEEGKEERESEDKGGIFLFSFVLFCFVGDIFIVGRFCYFVLVCFAFIDDLFSSFCKLFTPISLFLITGLLLPRNSFFLKK